MKKTLLLFSALLLFSSHDLFLKMGKYYLSPNQAASIDLYNGTFEKSENVITRDRMIDVSLVGNGTRTRVDSSQWTEKDSITTLSFTSGEEGTWVAGVSTLPRKIELTAQKFNDYLEHDGVVDMLGWRKQNNQLDSDAVEKYSKHVKTIFQVGDKRTKDWQTKLGYPIEFIPLSNPYDAKAGDNLKFQLLWNGAPLPNQLVYLGAKDAHHDHSHDHENGEDHHHDATKLQTDSAGVVSIKPASNGVYFLRTIYMVNLAEGEYTHESNWATITFEIGKTTEVHAHDDGHTHSHDGHSHGSMYLLAGIIFLLLVLLALRLKSKRG